MGQSVPPLKRLSNSLNECQVGTVSGLLRSQRTETLTRSKSTPGGLRQGDRRAVERREKQTPPESPTKTETESHVGGT